jgi:hypothetical protein
MAIQRDVRISAQQGRKVEEKIRAAEAWNDLRRENARINMHSYGQSTRVLKHMLNSEMQLSLWPENDPLSER